MRGLGLIGLVLALVIVGLVAKKQMTGAGASARPAVSASGEAPANVPVNSPDHVQQAQQVQQQVKDALDAAAKTRQMPDDN
ncbi:MULTISPECIES: hypothetical protein [unclassified Variovorax]|uniref:hypothetical protein n=1 Tax=unclassified Variovorax TaxID=663243 RepID=UPI0008C808D1|nr:MULTISPECIES: hypothetical protein [unclassified Variovorax]SEJ73945.1 hypothetical protein SAMN05518853_103325 [Variovorax sp. OK202]SFC86147.1 hypothetical protein SAMN05444746_103325 [Variovorax sp. OK212]